MSSLMIKQRPIVSIAAVTAAAAILIPAFYRYLTKNASKFTYAAGFPVAPMSFWSQTVAFFKLGTTEFFFDMERLTDGAKEFWCYIMFRKSLRISRVLTATYPLIKKSANEALTNLSELSSSDKPVEPLRHARFFTYTAISANIFGSVESHYTKFLRLFDDMLIWEKGISDLVIPVWMNGPYAKGMKARKVIADAIQEIMDERRLWMRGGRWNEEGEGLTDIEIVDNVIAFVFAGYDTSASTISSALHILVNEISESDLTLLRNEIISSNPSSESEISSLPVLEAFTKEVLRLYSPIPSTFRQAASDITLPDGRIVPKGSTISLDIRGSTFSQELFPEPRKFDLSKFLVEEIDKKFPYAVLPFSAGPRMCVGYQLAKLEIKVFTCEAIQRFDLRKSDIPTTFAMFPMYAASPSIFVSPKLEQ
ncbi:Thromboxane-A synthase [Blyttiomyces sp. JEL0837]|nr:Thromboxane-A synthase [Blyttiomyces sp. JEL0837]